MNEQQRRVLTLRDTDINAAIYRCCNDEKLYGKLMRDFLTDKTMSELMIAVQVASWDEAFTAAHALKGLAGNLGFVPLMHSTGKLVVTIRGGRTLEIPEAVTEVRSCYRDITDAIRQYLSYEE